MLKFKEIIEKLKRWVELDNIDLTKNPKYWKKGEGLTKEGWEKDRQIEKEKNKILKEIGLNGLLRLDDLECPYFLIVEDLINLLEKVEEEKNE